MNQAALEFADQQAVILRALHDHAFDVDAKLPGEAAVTFVTGHTGTASWTDDWFYLQVGVARGDRQLPSFDRVQNALHLNALAEHIRFILPQQSCTLSLITEFPLRDIPPGNSDLLRRRTEEACVAANLALRSEFSSIEQTADTTTPEGETNAAETLVREAGWSVVSATDNYCRVELEIRGACQQATVECGLTCVRLSTELLDEAPDIPVLRQHAASVYLLTVPSRVRLVAAVVDLRERTFNPTLQVTLPVDADAAMVDHALAVLGIAHEASADQVNALTACDALAGRFLELQVSQAAPRGANTTGG